MEHPEIILADDTILNRIFIIRNQKVMLDRDLAFLYNVSTKVLNQAVKRHRNRFPNDFMFQLTLEELTNWKSQFVTSNSIRLGIRKLPMVFTEQGVAMLSSVLNSERAVEVNIRIIRLFIRMREVLLSNRELMLKVTQLEQQVGIHSDEITRIFTVLKQLIRPTVPPMEKVGYKINNSGK